MKSAFQIHARFQNSATLLSYWLKVFMLLEAAMDKPSACGCNYTPYTLVDRGPIEGPINWRLHNFFG